MPNMISRNSYMMALILAAVLGSIYFVVFNESYNSRTTPKYEFSAGLVQHFLFGQQDADLETLCHEFTGYEVSLQDCDFTKLIGDERPLFFLYYAIVKTMASDHFTANLILSLIMLLLTLMLAAHALAREKQGQFMLLSVLLISPFYIHQGFVLQPHIPELLLTVAGLWFYLRKQYFIAFLLLGLSAGFHPGNLILVAGFVAHLLVQSVQDRRWQGLITGGLGGLGALALIELFFFLLFQADSGNLLGHEYFTERLLFSSPRSTEASFAQAPSAVNFFRNAFLFLPIATLSLFLPARNLLKFCTVILPVMIYLVSTDFRMPGAHRVLLPVFYLSSAFLITAFVNGEITRWFRTFLKLYFAAAILASGLFYLVAFQAEDLNVGQPVAVAPVTDDGMDEFQARQLLLNLARFNDIDPAADLKYQVDLVPVSTGPNIIDPAYIYPYLIYKAADLIVPKSLFDRLGLERLGAGGMEYLSKEGAGA